ncbi:MAG: hypothetical protein WB493_10280 [Anaeromyxobacteraceae bacterium]
MSALKVFRVAAVAVGLLALSPAVLVALRAGESLGGVVFVLLILVDALALSAVAWGLRSLSAGALLGTVAAFPWLFYFNAESGPWAYLFAAPELLMFAGLGWYGVRREKRKLLRWLGALVPTLAIIYAVVAPFVGRA